jgi:predicted RNA binding protein with dsRBD fold (UPF0201 family)
MVRITVSCPIYPSEDPAKVRDAVLSIFPDADLREEAGRLSGEASIECFAEAIRKQKILDSARSALFRGRTGDSSVIDLNKQAASVGKVSFTEPGSVLGSIEVTVADDDLEGFIDTVAPVTVDGREV